MIDEIGGNAEENASEYGKAHVKKPVVGFVCGADCASGTPYGARGCDYRRRVGQGVGQDQGYGRGWHYDVLLAGRNWSEGSKQTMSVERTFSIIKPDAVAAGQAGDILAMIQGAGFRVLGLRMLRLSEAQAQAFYAAASERPFFGGLVKFMTEGPIVVMALEREDAVWHSCAGDGRDVNSRGGGRKARFVSGLPRTVERNCIHGSDAPETAAEELRFFFSTADLTS